jgi:PhnB protein
MAKTKKKAKAKAKAKPKAKKPAKKKSAPKKAKKVSPIPKGYHAVTPYLVVDGCARALSWYADVFDAKEKVRMDGPGGMIVHSEIQIGDSVVMLADTHPPNNVSDTSICLYVKDCDDTFARAVAAGATVLDGLTNKFYGDRMGTIRDPFGQKWSIGTHIEDVSPAEMAERMAAMGPPPQAE